jgi:myo-inositol-1(or 4)-monophosphatase
MQDNLTREASRIVRQSVEEVGLNDREVNKSKESRFSYLTDTDLRLDKILSQRLENNTGYPVLSEEDDSEPSEDSYWTVDPIDGTVPFAHRMPNYVSMVSLVEDNVPTNSVIYCPETDEMFTATEDSAYIDGDVIEVSDSETLEEEAVFCSVRADGVYEDDNFRRLHTRLTYDSIVFGVFCAGFGATRVATGDVVAAVYASLSEWDYMPTLRLVESSGGVVGQLKSGETGMESVIGSNASMVCFTSTEDVFEELYEMYHRN